jgi:hypothetical protein
LSFTCLGPARSTAAAEARIATRTARRGPQFSSVAAGSAVSWQAEGNTAQALRDETLQWVEHYEARAAGIELTWVFSRPLPGEGDLILEAGIAGLSFERQTPSGLHFADAGGIERLKVGAAQAVDQLGRVWPLTLAAGPDYFRVVVPAAVLTEAQYPLAIDPLISAEFGVDQPVASATPCVRAAPAVAAGRVGYLAAWTHGKGESTDPAVYAARIGPAGDLLEPYGILVSPLAGEQTTCAVAANPDLFLVAWSAPRPNSSAEWDILGARVTLDGIVLDTPPIPLCTLSGIQCSPAVAANGNSFLVTWRDSRSTGIYGTLVQADGRRSSTNGFAICNAANEQYLPSVAALGTNYLVVWQDYRKATATQSQSDVYAARVSGDGMLLDAAGIAVCSRTNSQYHPVVAADGTNFLVVWEDYDVGGNDLRGARIAPDGRLLDTDALSIVHAANASINPALAVSDSSFVLLWQDYRESPTNHYEARLYGARLNGEGGVISPGDSPLTAATGQSHPAVACRGNELLAVWQDVRNNPATQRADIFAGPGSASPNPTLQQEVLLSASANAQSMPTAAALGTNYLVVWADSRNTQTNGQDILGLRLDREGRPVETSPFAVSLGANHQVEPAVVAWGNQYLVVWSDYRNTPANATHADIYGTLVSFGGQVLQPEGIAICTVTNDQSQPTVAPLGPNFLVAWRDARHSTSAATRLDIYGTRVDPNGIVLGAGAVPICTNLPDQSAPAAAGAGTQALVVWTDARGGVTASDIYGARVKDDGLPIETNGFVICSAATLQAAPAVAADGQRYLVVWADSRNGLTNAPDIYGARVDLAGLVAPSNGFPIRLAPGPQTMPAVACGQEDYLVTWQEAQPGFTACFDVFGAMLGAENAISQALPLPLATGSSNHLMPSAVPGEDGRFLVVDQALYAEGRRVLGRLVSPQAIPVLTSLKPAAGGGVEFVVKGAVGEKYLVEGSTDLKTWVPILTFTNLNSSTPVSDPLAGGQSLRFYRAILLP